MTTPCYQRISKEEMEQKSTKTLLRLLNFYRRSPYEMDWESDCNGGVCKCRKECQAIKEMNMNDVYAVLATRPHIPNKQEARVIRQKRAREGLKMNSAR